MSLAVHCSSRRLLHSLSVATGSVHIYTPDKTALKKRRRALLFAHKERRIDRATREALTESLYDILRHRRLPGLIDRRDTYVSVRDLVRDSILASKI
jgi:hypothetical protein